MADFNEIKEKIDYCSNEKEKQVNKGEKPSFKALNKDKTTICIDAQHVLTMLPGERYKDMEHQKYLYPRDLVFYLNGSKIKTEDICKIIFPIIYNCHSYTGFDLERNKILNCIKEATNYENKKNKKKSINREDTVDSWSSL